MVIKVSDNDNFSSKHHTEELTIDERQEFITTIKNLTQSLFNLERTTQEQTKAYQDQAEAYQEQIKNLTDQVLKISEQLQAVLAKLERAESKNKEKDDLIKRLKVMCRNGQLDNDELKRMLFQGGQEKLKDKEAVPKIIIRRQKRKRNCKKGKNSEKSTCNPKYST